MVKKILKSLCFGILVLLVINIIGQFFNFNIPINLLTIGLVSFLRFSGLIVAVVLLFL